VTVVIAVIALLLGFAAGMLFAKSIDADDFKYEVTPLPDENDKYRARVRVLRDNSELGNYIFSLPRDYGHPYDCNDRQDFATALKRSIAADRRMRRIK
jgi:hypothetical protein